MHAVILHGGTARQPALEAVHGDICAALQDIGWSVETLRLAEMTICPCVGCFGCWLRTPGECLMDDDGRLTARKQAQTDARIVLSPVSFGGYSGLVKAALDRMIPTISPLFELIHGEVHHRLRYPNPAAWYAVGWQPRPDAAKAELFARLNERNAINGHSPHHGALVFTDDETSERRRQALAALFHPLEAQA